MSFTIIFNHIEYKVIEHAAGRMLDRYISEAILLDVLYHGSYYEQRDGRSVYERETPLAGEDVLLRVVVDHDTTEIVSVMIVDDKW